jgi:hypothetical protein
MAETDQIPQAHVKETPVQKLKYLEFVQIAVLHIVIYVSKIYDYAKDNSGPLKTGVQTVEGTVKTVVGPVYQKYHGVPIELLKFFDRKVDDSVNKVESHIPLVLKQISSKALLTAQHAPSTARSVASEVKKAGVLETATELAKTVYVKYEPIAKGVYYKYEPLAEHYAVYAWRSLNNLPFFPQVAHAVLPTASYITERYNQTVQQSAKKGFRVASYLPLVPTEKIAKVFSSPSNQSVAADGAKNVPINGVAADGAKDVASNGVAAGN